MQVTPIGGTSYITQLATHVTALMFTLDPRDPSVIMVTLRLDIPYDQTGLPSHTETLVVSNQIIHLIGVAS